MTDWIKIIWAVGCGIVIPGLLLGFVNAWWNLFVAPLWGVTLAGLLELPILNIVFAVLFFFAAPALVWAAILSFIVGVRIALD